MGSASSRHDVADGGGVDAARLLSMYGVLHRVHSSPGQVRTSGHRIHAQGSDSSHFPEEDQSLVRSECEAAPERKQVFPRERCEEKRRVEVVAPLQTGLTADAT